MAQMPAWSYSSLTAYETCPKRYQLTRVLKQVTEPQTEATRWGNQVHKALELRVKDKVPLPPGMSSYEPLCAKLDVAPGQVFTEAKMAMNAQFQPVKWMAKDCWVRSILDVQIDAGENAAVLDWKTGKAKPESSQLKLSAAFVFHTRPYVQKVSTSFVWLKENTTTKETFTRDQLPDIWQEFLPRVRRLEIAFQDDKWEAKPSGLCKSWCPVGKALCEHCGT